MTKDTYTLEFLIKKFSQHKEESKVTNNKLCKQFKNNNPKTPIPEYLQNPFNIPEALLCICKEIDELKKKRK